MSKKGGSKNDLFQTIVNLQKELATIREQRAILLSAVALALRKSSHDKNCWTLQKNAPGPCTCYISELVEAIRKGEVRVEP